MILSLALLLPSKPTVLTLQTGAPFLRGGEGGPQNQIQTIGCELQLPYPGFQKSKTSLTQPQTPFQARADESEPAKQAKESDCHLSLCQHLCASGPGILETCDPSPGDYWATTIGQWAGNRPPTAAPLDHLIPDVGGCAINCSGGSPWGVWTGGQVGECGDGW